MLARAAAAQDDARDVSRPMRAAPARPHPRPCFTRHLGIVLTANEFLCTLMARVVHAPNHPGMQKRTVGGDALLPRSRTTRGRCARVHASVHHQLKGTLMFRAACIECIYAGHSNRERDSADVLFPGTTSALQQPTEYGCGACARTRRLVGKLTRVTCCT